MSLLGRDEVPAERWTRSHAHDTDRRAAVQTGVAEGGLLARDGIKEDGLHQQVS